jgi:AcrR family transcriptional regulator
VESFLKDTSTTRNKILQATLDIISKEGFQHVTIKKIADLAEVNIAAVNYHFGSKSKVVDEAMKVFAGKLMKSFDALENKDVAPRERLESFLSSYAESALEHPDVFKSFVSSAINDHENSCEYIQFLKHSGLDKVRSTLQEAGVRDEKELLTMKMLQMIGALELPILLGDHMKDLAGMNYQSREIRGQYIDLILKFLLT